jgi:8-oxo-dGTP diphosphatase
MKSGRDAIGDELALPRDEVNRRRSGSLDRVIDRAWQLAYAIAYRLLRAWWFVRRPAHRGALVALWHGGEILLLRSSSRNGWSLPGGGIAHGESARDAAIRELREAQAVELAWEHRSDHTTIFEIEMTEPPALRLDHREIVAAGFHRPGAIDPRTVAPHVALYLARFQAG